MINEIKGYQTLTLDPFYKDELVNNLKPNSIHFLSLEERVSFKVECQEGTLFRNGKIYATEVGKKIYEPITDAFVISPNEELYAGAISPKKFHHSSFLSGGNVVFAGELETNAQGKMLKITNRSGHYKPEKEHLLQALSWFQAKGIDLTAVDLHEYDKSRPNEVFVYFSAKKYLDSLGNCPVDQKFQLP